MPPHDNSFGKNDPLSQDNGDTERRNRRSGSGEDADMSAATSPPSILSSPGSVPLPVMMFGFARAGNASPPPGPVAMRMEGPVAPMQMDELHAVLRGVLELIDEDDFADMDGLSTGNGGSSSSSRVGGAGASSRGYASFPPRSHSPSDDHYRAQ